MPWISIKIETSGENAEKLSDLLMELGGEAVSIEDSQAGTSEEEPLYKLSDEPVHRLWRACLVKALFSPESDIHLVFYVVFLL